MTKTYKLTQSSLEYALQMDGMYWTGEKPSAANGWMQGRLLWSASR